MLHNHLSQTAGNLLTATAGFTGEQFFAAMAKALADNLGMRWALIGEIKGDRISVIAGHGNGAPIDVFDYELRGSPCEQVLTQATCTYRADVTNTFPEGKLLSDMGVESYFGITVHGASGLPIGIINAMNDKPIVEAPECLGLLQLFALRVGAEIERRSLEQQLSHSQKLKSLSVLTGGIADKFDNLLAGILGNIETALSARPASDQGVTQPLNDAKVAARAAGQLTRQLQAYADSSDSNRQQVTIAKHVEETASMMRRMLQSGTQLQINIPDNAPSIIADPSQLRQVLLNLIVNANESLEGAAGTITITLEVSPPNSPEFGHIHHSSNDFNRNTEHVAISIRDTGVGLSRTATAQIFDPFFSSKGLSRGLGLSAVLGILDNHDGAIAIDTSPGQGSTFTVYFPTTTEVAPAVTDLQPTSPKKRLRVLVVDDNDIVRKTLARMLERLGYIAIEAETGDAALKVIEAEDLSFDCMVIDRIMPGLSGPQLINSIRSIDADVPIVLTTGFGDANDMPPGTISGLLSKPWTANDVVVAMRGALGQPAE